LRTERVNRTGFTVTPARRLPPRTAHEQHGAERRFAILGDPVDRYGKLCRHIGRNRFQVIIQNVISLILARGADHQQAQARPCCFGIDAFNDR
jgi:hypothetical protein